MSQFRNKEEYEKWKLGKIQTNTESQVIRKSQSTPCYRKWWVILIVIFAITGISMLNFLSYKEKSKDSSHLIQAASQAIHENKNEDAIAILKSIEIGDKSYQFAQEILYGLTEGREGKKRTSTISYNPEPIIKSRLNRPDSWVLRSVQYKDGILICGVSAAWKALTPVWYAKGGMVYAVNGAANSINSVKYEFVSSENSPELGISISDIVAVCERLR